MSSNASAVSTPDTVVYEFTVEDPNNLTPAPGPR